jgi:hypothetical protein
MSTGRLEKPYPQLPSCRAEAAVVGTVERILRRSEAGWVQIEI